MKISEWAIRHWITIFVFVFVLGVVGLMSYSGLPREASPDIKIPFVMVTTPYFGVAPADIESLITDKIEEELEQLKDVREIRSTSAEGASIISIEFEPRPVGILDLDGRTITKVCTTCGFLSRDRVRVRVCHVHDVITHGLESSYCSPLP